MIIVAVVVAAALVAVVAIGGSIIRSLIRQHARERDLMLNQLLNLAGRPWQPPPSEPEPELAPDDGRYVLTPESLPDY